LEAVLPLLPADDHLLAAGEGVFAVVGGAGFPTAGRTGLECAGLAGCVELPGVERDECGPSGAHVVEFGLSRVGVVAVVAVLHWHHLGEVADEIAEAFAGRVRLAVFGLGQERLSEFERCFGRAWPWRCLPGDVEMAGDLGVEASPCVGWGMRSANDVCCEIPDVICDLGPFGADGLLDEAGEILGAIGRDYGEEDVGEVRSEQFVLAMAERLPCRFCRVLMRGFRGLPQLGTEVQVEERLAMEIWEDDGVGTDFAGESGHAGRHQPRDQKAA